MDVTISEPLESFVRQAVSEGRYSSETEVVNQSLRMLQENERKLAGLRAMIAESLADDMIVTAEEMDADLEAQLQRLHAQGIPW